MTNGLITIVGQGEKAMQTLEVRKPAETVKETPVSSTGMPETSYRIGKVVRNMNDAEIWVVYAEELMHKGDHAKALEYFDKAIQGAPKSARVYNSKADALDAMGKFDEALSHYNIALAHDPLDAECWFNKGVTLKKLGRNSEASECINHSVKISMGI